MAKEKLYIFDTTLRDGQQTQGVDFSVQDKIIISEALDKFGLDYIEGGWPGANPTDTKFFESRPKLRNSKFTANPIMESRKKDLLLAKKIQRKCYSKFLKEKSE